MRGARARMLGRRARTFGRRARRVSEDEVEDAHALGARHSTRARRAHFDHHGFFPGCCGSFAGLFFDAAPVEVRASLIISGVTNICRSLSQATLREKPTKRAA